MRDKLVESTSLHGSPGRVAERLNAAVLKTARRAIPVSGVRIPPLPFRRGSSPADREALHWLLQYPGEVAEWLKALAC
jgi:hypothetical protein